jgi:hypothetical protein
VVHFVIANILDKRTFDILECDNKKIGKGVGCSDIYQHPVPNSYDKLFT